MRKPAIKRIEHRLRQTALAAIMIAIVPAAAAFAEHFKIVNSLLPTPSAESVIFCSPYLGEIDYESTPSAEEYMFDQIFQ